mgnify:CR=1 FL=1
MKAAVYRSGSTLTVEEVAIPEIADDEILVKVAACGVCHTDLHYLDHGVPTFKKPPLTLGHEASGIIARAGRGVNSVREGDRVLLPAVVTCGHCVMCREGRENICMNMKMFGNHIDGAFAEYVKAPAKDAIPLPLDLPLEESCIIADALSTPFHAVRNRARVLPGDTVAVFGCGGVGINVVQIAVACGAKVLAVDVSPEKLELAVAFGASEVVLPKEGENVAKTIRGKTDGGVDVAIEAIGNPITLGQAFDSVKRGGRLCIVGYSDKPFTIAAAKVMFHEIEIVGSLGCRPVDYPRIIEMIRAGRVQLRPLVTGRFPLSEVNAAIDTLRSGKGLRNIVVP